MGGNEAQCDPHTCPAHGNAHPRRFAVSTTDRNADGARGADSDAAPGDTRPDRDAVPRADGLARIATSCVTRSRRGGL